MEFKFRAGDDRPPSSLSPSSSMSFFSDQALRANYSTDPNFIRSQIEMYTIQREIEKEKIRLEIIAAENVRRRLLEEEVRRELMMERETAARESSETRLSTEESHTTQPDSRFPVSQKLDNHSLEDQLAFPENRSLGFGIDMLPHILPQLSNAVTDEHKSALEINKKEKLIILAKPNPNLCGLKRKAETPPAAPGELPFTNMKKKAKEEWSCALCEVSATCERGLNEHLQGRKHKAKEARLRAQAQKMRNNSNLSHSKESGKLIKVTVGGDTANPEQKTKVEEQSCQPNKAQDASDQKMDELDLKNKDEKLLKNQDNKNEKVPKKNQKAKNQKRKKFKFWCEVCQVGAHSGIVMEGHKKGRKHLARLKEPKLNDEAAATIITTTNMTKGKDADVLVEEANKKTTGNDASVAGANEKTEDGAVVLENNEKGTENDAVVEVNEETVENVATVKEKASENDAVGKEPTEKTAGDNMVLDEANEKTAENAAMDEGANEKMAEDDAIVEEANEKIVENAVIVEEANQKTAENAEMFEEVNDQTAGNGMMVEEATETTAENGEMAEEVIEKTAENDVVAEEANQEAAENIAGETD